MVCTECRWRSMRLRRLQRYSFSVSSGNRGHCSLWYRFSVSAACWRPAPVRLRRARLPIPRRDQLVIKMLVEAAGGNARISPQFHQQNSLLCHNAFQKGMKPINSSASSRFNPTRLRQRHCRARLCCVRPLHLLRDDPRSKCINLGCDLHFQNWDHGAFRGLGIRSALLLTWCETGSRDRIACAPPRYPSWRRLRCSMISQRVPLSFRSSVCRF